MDELRELHKFNEFLALPSLFVMICICFLFFQDRWRALLLQNKLMTGFISILLIMNFLEVLTYGNFYTNYNFSLRVYYCTAVILASIFLFLSDRLNDNALLTGKVPLATILIIPTLLCGFILFSNLIIAGYTKDNYIISRYPGNYYWFFQIYSLLHIFIGVYLIYVSIKQASNSLDKKRRIVILISFLPLILTSVLAMFFIQLGLYINQLAFLPFSTLLFITVYLFTETRHDLFRFLVNVPYSPERAAYKALNDRVIDYVSKTQTNEKFPLKEFMHDIETSIIDNVLDLKDGNHTLTAELLSVSPSTVYRNKKKKED